MTTKALLIIALVLSLAGCTTQAEFATLKTGIGDLRKDAADTKANVTELRKRLTILDENIKGTLNAQNAMADYGAKSDQLATDIQLLQGKLEENNFRISEIAQKLDDKTVKISELSAKLDELEAKVKLLSGETGTGESKSKTGSRTMEPSEAYRQAKTDYDKGNIDLALAGFQNYVVQFPDTSQASSAQYWVGECYYAKKNFKKAIEAFTKVIKTYPKSEKVRGAKLKIGLSYLGEKNTAKAREYFRKVIKEYRGTNEAHIAKDRLRKIRK
jgi:tol-pal system protein YbgF